MRATRQTFLTENAYSRVQTLGASGASLVDLLALGIADSESDLERAQGVAMKLAPELRKFRGLADLEQKQLEAKGASSFAAVRCLALIELGRRLATALSGPGAQIQDAEDIQKLLDHLRYEKKEHFVTVLLDTQNVVLKVETVHIGTLNSSIVGPREIFREAIREGASSMIVAHNHPSGEVAPSREDIELTKRLVEIGKMLDIPVLDHVILGERKFFSMRTEGFMK